MKYAKEAAHVKRVPTGHVDKGSVNQSPAICLWRLDPTYALQPIPFARPPQSRHAPSGNGNRIPKPMRFRTGAALSPLGRYDTPHAHPPAARGVAAALLSGGCEQQAAAAAAVMACSIPPQRLHAAAPQQHARHASRSTACWAACAAAAAVGARHDAAVAAAAPRAPATTCSTPRQQTPCLPTRNTRAPAGWARGAAPAGGVRRI